MSTVVIQELGALVEKISGKSEGCPDRQLGALLENRLVFSSRLAVKAKKLDALLNKIASPVDRLPVGTRQCELLENIASPFSMPTLPRQEHGVRDTQTVRRNTLVSSIRLPADTTQQTVRE